MWSLGTSTQLVLSLKRDFLIDAHLCLGQKLCLVTIMISRNASVVHKSWWVIALQTQK
ncbi:unnamed protein product [Strongylus vulgaris]|uniref:Uncharacterized protein n=1 Tax=Strongylus vulgaris TaxID=40348 RepID=A0A3P7IZ36_STRVU|nr:unnamed protein product [Strongylus vulgaris]